MIAAEKLVKTCDQSQSRLFSKLPLELRQSIYRYVLGGKVIHVTRLQTRLGHVTCFHVAREDVKKPYSPSSHQCWGIRYARTTLFNGLRDEERTDDKDAVSALVKTCRRVYSESIGFLYQENVFNVNTPETILLLKETVLPHRLQVISSVEMTWIVSYEDAVDTSEKWLMRKGAWEQAWKVLGDMKGLQSLWVQLQQDAGWEMSIEDEERVVLQKAKNVRLSGHKKWTLVLHWDTMNDVSDAEQLPFRIENRQTIWCESLHPPRLEKECCVKALLMHDSTVNMNPLRAHYSCRVQEVKIS